VQARIDAEDAAPVEIHTVRAQLHQAQLDLSLARNQADTSRAGLRAALGAPDARIGLADELREPAALPDLDESLAAALAARPDIARQEAMVRGARVGAKLARIQRSPRVTVLGAGEYGRHNGSSGPSWSVYGGVEQTLFDGGATRAAVARADAELRAAQAQLQRLKQDVQVEVETAWLSIRQSAEATASALAARDEAQAALSAAETRYSARVGILLEVTDAQARAEQADVGVLRAQYDYNLAVADLQRATGAQP
jgi:OMF family outer membrane factor